MIGFHAGPLYVSLKSPRDRAYFSERNGYGTFVIGWPQRWRITLRRRLRFTA